jgi:hypothetical protein
MAVTLLALPIFIKTVIAVKLKKQKFRFKIIPRSIILSSLLKNAENDLAQMCQCHILIFIKKQGTSSFLKK